MTLTYRDAVRAAAYGASFAAELRRLRHGDTTATHEHVGDFVESTRTPIDATAAAKRRATEVAELAVRSLEP